MKMLFGVTVLLYFIKILGGSRNYIGIRSSPIDTSGRQIPRDITNSQDEAKLLIKINIQ